MLDAADVTALLDGLLSDSGLGPAAERHPVRVWAWSGVERLTVAGGASVVFKYAAEPFDTEDAKLRHAAVAGLPVPGLIASRHSGPVLGMLLEDLGEPVRDADEEDGAHAAVLVHRVSHAPGFTVLDTDALAALPGRIRDHLRHVPIPAAAPAAAALDGAAAARSAGCQLAPYGLVHSEFHPTSVHIGTQGLRVLDLARAFTGPGLIDLASWHGTTTPPGPDRTAAFIGRYVDAGGAPEAAWRRGGLDAASWALGWHRVWAAEWFADRMGAGWADGEEDHWRAVITRHLEEAAALLKA